MTSHLYSWQGREGMQRKENRGYLNDEGEGQGRNVWLKASIGLVDDEDGEGKYRGKHMTGEENERQAGGWGGRGEGEGGGALKRARASAHCWPWPASHRLRRCA